MSGHIVQRPVSFRAQDVAYVMQSLLSARSCALIGVDGIGKSSFLRHLLSAQVRDHYLAEHSAQHTFLLIDAHALAQPSALAYYRRMTALLEQVLLQHNVPLPEASQLSRIDEETAILVLFERVKTLMIFQESLHLVFAFDEFTLTFTEIEPQFLRVLHALRGTHLGRISYLVTSRNVPILLCDPSQQKIVFQMFAELFNGYIRGLKPLAEVDAFAQLDLWLAQEHASLPFSLRKLCIHASGAHQGLLKAMVLAVADGSLSFHDQDGLEILLEQALHHPSILNQCELLWQSLSEMEHHCLRYLRHGAFLRSSLVQSSLQSSGLLQEALKMLLLKGLLIEVKSDAFQCFSPLFATFVARQGVLGLQLDPLRQQVWVDGIQQTRRLTNMEFKLLRFLASHAEDICSREETTHAIYGDRYQAREDAARLDALVERTRKSIGDTSRPPRFLETIRSIGHRLNNYAGERF
jgi:Transcriptional regulatory protein, C terminal